MEHLLQLEGRYLEKIKQLGNAFPHLFNADLNSKIDIIKAQRKNGDLRLLGS